MVIIIVVMAVMLLFAIFCLLQILCDWDMCSTELPLSHLRITNLPCMGALSTEMCMARTPRRLPNAGAISQGIMGLARGD